MTKDWFEVGTRGHAYAALARMHGQWFADDDDVDDVDDDDEVVVEDDDDDDDIPLYLEGRDEIPADDDGDAGPDAEALQSRLAALEEEKAAYEARLADREVMTSGFSELTKVFREQAEAGKATAKTTAEPWEAVKKRLSKSFYDDPVAAMEEAMKYMVTNDIAPAFQSLQGEVSKTALAASRQGAKANDTNRMIMEKYSSEVEAAVKGLPAGSDVYERACQQVGMAHLTDLVAMQVELSAGTKEKAPRPTSNVNPSGSGGSRGTKKRSSKPRVLTTKQQEAANKMGVSFESYWNVING